MLKPGPVSYGAGLILVMRIKKGMLESRKGTPEIRICRNFVAVEDSFVEALSLVFLEILGVPIFAAPLS